MKYVVIGTNLVWSKNGLYCQFYEPLNWQRGAGGKCAWGKLSSATIFDTFDEAKQTIAAFPWWVESCKAIVVAIHPLNISH